MSEQVTIDLDYDDRVPGLVREVAIMVAPHLSPGTKTETNKILAERVVKLVWQRLAAWREPAEPMRCHTCDDMTLPQDRVRVVVCARCSLEGRSPGCST